MITKHTLPNADIAGKMARTPKTRSASLIDPITRRSSTDNGFQPSFDGGF